MAWLAGWDKRIRLSIPEKRINTTVSGFPTLVHLSDSCGINSSDATFIFDELSDANRKKIAVTDRTGDSQCYVEIEYWDSVGRKACLWARLPLIRSDVDTDFYLYYDSTVSDNNNWVGDTGSTPAESVWSNNYAGVWHFNDATIEDSTSNGKDGTPTNVTITAGEIGNAASFNGTSSYIDLPGGTFPNNDYTISTITKLNTEGVMHSIFTTQNDYYFYIYVNDSNQFQIQIYDGATSYFIYYDGAVSNRAYHLTIVKSSAYGLLFYIDGVMVDSDPLATTNNDPVSGYSRIGNYNSGTMDQYFLDGIIEEARASSVCRSDGWIKTTYYSNSDNLILFFGEPQEVTWLEGFSNRLKLTIDKTKVDAPLTNFPLMINLSDSAGITNHDVSAVFDELSSYSDRKRIAITTEDGVTQCPVEIDVWDNTNEQAIMWTKPTYIYSDYNTIMYLYYDVTYSGSGGTGNTDYIGDLGDSIAETVWDENFVGVWHMAQDPAASNILDSTSNAVNLIPQGTMTSGDSITYGIGKAIDFDGLDDYLYTTGISNMNTAAATWEVVTNGYSVVDDISYYKHGIVTGLDLGAPGSWDDGYHYHQSVLKDNTNYKMWYGASDGGYYRIGLATSASGTTWTKQGMVLDFRNSPTTCTRKRPNR